MEQVPFHASSSRTQTLDEWVLDGPEASFLMKMSGDSMRDYGIYHGDMLVIERAAEARMNDLVVTVQDGSWSINAYKDILEATEQTQEHITVQAVVKAVIRKYE